MSANPYQSPDTPDSSSAPIVRRPRRWIRWTVLSGILIVLLVVLLLPARRTARPAARRIQCSNNLKQIALAIRSYESIHHALPPAYTVDANGRPLHSWRTLILPHLEHEELYAQIDLSKPWDDPANQFLRDANIPEYHCPAVAIPPGHTTYLANVGEHGCLQPASARQLTEITDNHELTLLVVEGDASHSVPWMSPADFSVEALAPVQPKQTPPHSHGRLVAFVDSHIVFVDGKLDEETLRAALSIDGNDDDIARRLTP